MPEITPGFENFNDVLFDVDSRFTVKQLKSICATLGLAQTANKPVLQRRIRISLEEALRTHDSATFGAAKNTAVLERGLPYGPTFPASRPANATNGYTLSGTSSAANHQGSSWGLPSVYQNIRQPVWKRLPFYKLLTFVTQAYNIPACPTSRTTQPIQLKLTTEMLNKLSPRGPTNAHRLVVFCTLTERINFGNCVVEFPSHAEIRCNGKVVPANLRGIKNKPGTINPPDITPQIIFMPSVTNKVDITFAESKNSYTVTIYLVEKFTVAQLVEKIRRKGMLSKEGTLNKMKAEMRDADIVPGPETLTLKDPISMTRIELPAKSRFCAHTSCFDLATFLTLNEQTPTWICPICSRSVSSEDDLFIDGYFNDILQNTNRAVESVVIYPTGTWTNKDIDTDHPDAKLLNLEQPRPALKQEERKSSFGVPKPEIVSLDDDESENGVFTPASLISNSVPPTTSTSMRPSPVATPSHSRKRGPPQVVDLTLSDDDEPTPPLRIRPITSPVHKRPRLDSSFSQQRPSLNITPNGLNLSNFPRISSSSSLLHTAIVRSPSSVSPLAENTSTPSSLFSNNNTIPTAPIVYQPVRASFPPPPNVSPPLVINTNPNRPFVPPPIPQPSPQLPTPSSILIPQSTNTDPNEREKSASPVLPAFSLPKPRQPVSSTNDFSAFDWDSVIENPESNNASWDTTNGNDFDDEELDLEMARLPSSMFDADHGREEDEDDF